MEGDETLVPDFTTPNDDRIRLVNSFDIAGVGPGGRSIIGEAIITIVDNDFVTIALDPDEHPDNPEVAEGEEIVFALTRPGRPGFRADGGGGD